MANSEILRVFLFVVTISFDIIIILSRCINYFSNTTKVKMCFFGMSGFSRHKKEHFAIINYYIWKNGTCYKYENFSLYTSTTCKKIKQVTIPGKGPFTLNSRPYWKLRFAEIHREISSLNNKIPYHFLHSL